MENTFSPSKGMQNTFSPITVCGAPSAPVTVFGKWQNWNVEQKIMRRPPQQVDCHPSSLHKPISWQNALYSRLETTCFKQPQGISTKQSPGFCQDHWRRTPNFSL